MHRNVSLSLSSALWWTKLKQNQFLKSQTYFQPLFCTSTLFSKLLFEALSALYAGSAELSGFNALYDSNWGGFLWSCHRFDQSYLNLQNTLPSFQNCQHNRSKTILAQFWVWGPPIILLMEQIVFRYFGYLRHESDIQQLFRYACLSKSSAQVHLFHRPYLLYLLYLL